MTDPKAAELATAKITRHKAKHREMLRKGNLTGAALHSALVQQARKDLREALAIRRRVRVRR